MEEAHKNGEVDPKKSVDSISLKKVHDSGSTLDSGAWIPALSEFEYRPKILNDPRNISCDKENAPPADSQTIPTFNNLNITEDKFCDRTKNLLGYESDWEVHVAQQIPLPRSSSPYPDDHHEALEQLEPEKDDDLDKIDYRARPANDSRPPKPTRR